MLHPDLTVILIAFALEAAIGDPVTRWHPVALFGSAMGLFLARAPSAGPRSQLLFGSALTFGAVAGVLLASAWLLVALSSMAGAEVVLIGAVLFKVSFSYRQLRSEALGLLSLLEISDLAGARSQLSALVSRDTSLLEEAGATSAAIESLAENLCDSVVAPFFYFVLLGVPGALAYRAVNTLDAMIGYHGGFEYLGKTAAKLDDWANWIPARLSAGLLIMAALLVRASPTSALNTVRAEHHKTESPNAGWPMAAMAGALSVTLEKPGHYQLGKGPAPVPADIRRAVRIADVTVGLAAVALIGLAL